MGHEGQASITVPMYCWEKAQTYYKAHKKELRKKGINSASKLVELWIEEKCAPQ
jgi:hypothetical protein